MGRTSRIVELCVLIALAAGGAFLTVGIHESTNNRAGPWYLATGVAFGLAVVIPLLYFGLHPLFVTLDRYRSSVIDAAHTMGKQQALVIFWAQYGAGTKNRDVKRRLQAQMTEQGALDLVVNPETMGGDPVPGVKKELRVSYAVAGETSSFKRWADGARLVLPPPSASGVSPLAPQSETPTTEPSPDPQPSPE